MLVEAASSARAADHSLHSAISLKGDDLVNAGLIAFGLEEAANRGDDGLGHLRRRRGFGGRVLPRPGWILLLPFESLPLPVNASWLA